MDFAERNWGDFLGPFLQPYFPRELRKEEEKEREEEIQASKTNYRLEKKASLEEIWETSLILL